jgi:glycosyltransferase involved in cell wall biosynthesis
LDLAIIIPAYKPDFFEKSLLSLSQQTNKNFSIYIGDDCSEYNLQAICNKFNDSLNINYHRFENNIGARKLVCHWQRCIDLIKNEKWIWLFSDDDMADSNCVEYFYKTIETDKSYFDIYRFNTRVINEKDEILESTPESPFVESSFQMTIELLKLKRGNSIVDHIFSKEIYLKTGGFVYTDYAQGADWALSILFSAEKGICTIPGAKVSWRLSSVNISGKAPYKNEMIKGHFQFCNWLENHFSYLKAISKTDYIELKKSIDYNLFKVIKSHYKGLYFFMYKDVYNYYVSNNNYLKSVFLTARLYALTRILK